MAKNKEINNNLYMRQGPDLILKLIKVIIQATWCLGVVVLVIACAAMPLTKNLLNTTFNTELNIAWNYTFLKFDFFLTIITFSVSIIGLYLSSLRQRRRTDRYSASLIIIGILSAISIAFYLIYF